MDSIPFCVFTYSKNIHIIIPRFIARKAIARSNIYLHISSILSSGLRFKDQWPFPIGVALQPYSISSLRRTDSKLSHAWKNTWNIGLRTDRICSDWVQSRILGDSILQVLYFSDTLQGFDQLFSYLGRKPSNLQLRSRSRVSFDTIFNNTSLSKCPHRDIPAWLGLLSSLRLRKWWIHFNLDSTYLFIWLQITYFYLTITE